MLGGLPRSGRFVLAKTGTAFVNGLVSNYFLTFPVRRKLGSPFVVVSWKKGILEVVFNYFGEFLLSIKSLAYFLGENGGRLGYSFSASVMKSFQDAK